MSLSRREFTQLVLVSGVSLAGMGLVGCASQSKSSTTPPVSQNRTVTDMVGRSVTLPSTVNTVATFGSVGVLNAFVECMGKGSLIANNMPATFTKTNQWAMQYKFAPQMTNEPVLETSNGINIEATMTLAPDVCITMTQDYAQQLQDAGLNAIVITWDNTEDVKTAVTLMGQVLGVEDRATDYNAYFDQMVAKASSLTKGIPDSNKTSVIYGDVEALTNPHIISEWWISAAGGKSVTSALHKNNTLQYTMENLLSWQPQVIFSSNSNLAAIYGDANISSLPAIKNKQVYLVPTVAHVWGNRTVEQPLTVMWAMNKLYPNLYSEASLAEDIKYFYNHFFCYTMTDAEISNIINYQ